MKHLRYLKIILPVLWTLNIITGAIQINLTTILLSSIVFGPLFCSFLCPFGFLSESIYKLGRLLRIPEIKINSKADYYLKFIRYILLIVTIIFTVPLIMNILSNDPQSNINILLQGNTLSFVALIVLIAFSLVSLLSRKFYCKYLCIEGAKHSLLSFGRIFNISRTEECVNCGLCSKNCKMQVDILKNQTINDPACINCLECIATCPKQNAIKVKPSLNRKKVIATITCILVLLGSFFINAIGPQKIAVEEDMTELYGSAVGFKDDINVSVIMRDDEILQVYIEGHNDDWMWFNQARQVADDIVSAQSTDVDTISGATYSSQGIINATKDALGEPFTEQVVKEKHSRH